MSPVRANALAYSCRPPLHGLLGLRPRPGAGAGDILSQKCGQRTTWTDDRRAQSFYCAASSCSHAFLTTGTGTPAILTLNEPRLVRVVKYTVFQSSPPKATLAVLLKPCTTRPSLLP